MHMVSEQSLHACQLIVNVSKTEVIVFAGKRIGVQDFTLNVTVMQRMEIYRYLEVVFHVVHGMNMAFGASFLVAAARKALFARRLKTFSGIRDPEILRSLNPELQCKLVET